MKNFSILCILIFLTFAYACSDQNFDSYDEIELRSSVDYGAGASGIPGNPNCDVLPELCPYPYLEDPRGPTDVVLSSGIVANPPTQVVYRTGSKEYTVQAIGHPEVSREFSVVTDDGVYVIAEASDEVEDSYTESTYRIPNCIYQVFDLDYSMLYYGDVTAMDVSELNGNREVESEGQSSKVVVNITGDEIDDCDPPVYTITIYDWCERKPATTAHAWMRNMMDNLNPTGITYVAMYNMIKIAAEECYKGLSCTDCIDPECILDGINALPDLNPSIAQTLNDNYIALVDEKLNDAYDIAPATVSTTSLEVKKFLVKEDCEPTVIGVCGVEIIGEDFVTALENGGSASIDDLLDDVAEEKDFIILSKAFKECSSLYCVFLQLKENNVELFCSTIDEGFISNPLSNLQLDVSHHVNNILFYFDKFGSAAGEASAITTTSNGSDVEIVFNKDRCSDGYSSVEFVRTLMHEAIHAKMFSDCWPAGASYDEYRKGFLACLQEHYLLELGSLPEQEQHIAMSNIFVEDIAEAINQYLGGNGSWEDYEYLAWQGLSQYPDYSNEQWFIDHLADAKERYENNTLPISDPCGN